MWVNSNQGDIYRVLNTVILILKEFLEVNKPQKVWFTGSDNRRQRVYERYVFRYLSNREGFIITGIKNTAAGPAEELYQLDFQGVYVAFGVRKNT